MIDGKKYENTFDELIKEYHLNRRTKSIEPKKQLKVSEVRKSKSYPRVNNKPSQKLLIPEIKLEEVDSTMDCTQPTKKQIKNTSYDIKI